MDPGNWSSFIFQAAAAPPPAPAPLQVDLLPSLPPPRGPWWPPRGTPLATNPPPLPPHPNPLPHPRRGHQTPPWGHQTPPLLPQPWWWWGGGSPSTRPTPHPGATQPSRWATTRRGGRGCPLPPSPSPPPPPPQKKPPKPKGPPHLCTLCSKEFKNAYNLRRHQATHGATKSGRGATKMPTMVPLSLLGGGESLGGGSSSSSPPPPTPKRARKSHACEMCGKAFRDVYHLKRHQLSHSDEKPFQCPVCHQRFKRKDRMSYHVRSHEGAVHKPYVCSHCGKSFSRPDHLNSHVRQVHSTERPFKCQTCEAAFATKDRLRAHTVRHEEKVPCHVCGKMLSAAYISDHMKVHSQGPNHVCQLCSKGTGEPCPMATPGPTAVAVLPMEGAPGGSQPW